MAARIALALLLLLMFTGSFWAMLLVRAGPERIWRATPARPASDRLNLLIWLALTAAQSGLAPAALGGLTTLAVNLAGGGLIVLPAQGWGLALGAATYLMAMDLSEYVFHRAQHAIPVLWAMHSLHHSDPHFDSTTASRHFWLEPLIKSLTVWLAVGLLFKASPTIVLLYTAAGYLNVLTHSNTRLNLGPLSWLVNTPAYHRLHHSALEAHWNCNFAALLPIYDVIFGGYRRPGRDEYPPTGLDTGERPEGPGEAVLWPLRYARLRRAAQVSLEAAP